MTPTHFLMSYVILAAQTVVGGYYYESYPIPDQPCELGTMRPMTPTHFLMSQVSVLIM
jgi:hypothetical protein